MPDPSRAAGSHMGLPRWVKGLGAVVGLAVLMAVVLAFAGHGPGQHMPGADVPLAGPGESPG